MSDIVQPTVSDGAVDGLVVLTDTLMEVAEVIPVVGKLLQFARASRSVADALFVSKVAKFLQTFSTVSREERDRFLDMLSAKGEAERFGEALLLMLDKADEAEKPMVLGRLFCAAAQDRLSFEMARRLGSILNRAYFADLLHLDQFRKESVGRDPHVASALQALGLLYISTEDYGSIDLPNSGGTYYQLSEYGQILLKFGLNESG